MASPGHGAPWSLLDGPEVAGRIEIEYALRLLDSLLQLQDDAPCMDDLVEGYRLLTDALAKAANTRPALDRAPHESAIAHLGFGIEVCDCAHRSGRQATSLAA